MIPILCMACNSHILNTDSVRLHFPFSGEMFDPVVKGFRLRAGYLSLDTFCPVCLAFPFYHDGGRKGFRGVGRLLKSKDANGKAKMMEVDEILSVQALMSSHWPSGPQPAVTEASEAQQSVFEQCKEPDKPVWPCPECGSKRAIHKKNCSKKSGGAKSLREYLAMPSEDTFLKGLISEIEKSVDIPPESPPTEQELRELEAERIERVVRDNSGLRNYTGG